MKHEESASTAKPFRTPHGLKILAALCIALPVAMMVHNTDILIQDLEAETETLTSENGLLTEAVRAGREANAVLVAEKRDLAEEIRVGEIQRDDLLAKLDRSERRGESLVNVVGLLREELEVAEEEAKLVAATYKKSTNQLRKLVNNSEETAYALLQENRELKELARRQETSMIEMLGEVSSLNAELAYIKDERDEMSKEILRITAQVKSLEAETGVMQVNAKRPATTKRRGG